MYCGLRLFVRNSNDVIDYITIELEDRSISVSWDDSEWNMVPTEDGYYEYTPFFKHLSYTDDEGNTVYPGIKMLKALASAKKFTLCLRDRDTEEPERNFHRISLTFEEFDEAGNYVCHDVPRQKIFVEQCEDKGNPYT